MTKDYETKRKILRSELAIDVNDIDRCLAEQAELRFQASEEFELAQADRDTFKLDLEEAEAEIDITIRVEASKAAARAEEQDKKVERLTDTAIQKRIQASPRIKEINRKLLDAKVRMGAWRALKDGFEDRSGMLREIVARQVAQWYDTNVDRGMASARNRRSEVVNAQLADRRREKLSRAGGSNRVGE